MGELEIGELATSPKMASCPRCGVAGREVAALTVKGLVAASSARDVGEGPYRLCATPSCEAVYYGRDGSTILKDQLTVRVGLKETEAPRPVCYCFGYSVESIRDEIRRTGRSNAASDITAKIKAGLCACEVKNPEGVCCLGRVSSAVKDAMGSGAADGVMASGSHRCPPSLLRRAAGHRSCDAEEEDDRGAPSEAGGLREGAGRRGVHGQGRDTKGTR